MQTIKKVFIAGGTGFLGYHAALKFLDLGIQVDTIALENEITISNLVESGKFPSFRDQSGTAGR